MRSGDEDDRDRFLYSTLIIRELIVLAKFKTFTDRNVPKIKSMGTWNREEVEEIEEVEEYRK